MPWKGEKDPYRIWLSEVILQQTRVDQGLAYYHRFINTFPTVKALAAAPEKQVFRLWEGLGYYTRCRNLIATAQIIASKYDGIFPSTYAKIIKLKGIGPYTAAAIASFAFQLPYAVVDGNVIRVLARVFGIDDAADNAIGRKKFDSLAGELLDKKQPGIYNQAIMDFGATVCRPVSPLCTGCVFNKECAAYRSGRVNELPAKKKKPVQRTRHFYFFVLQYRGAVAVHERTEADIWRHLHTFPFIEANDDASAQPTIHQATKCVWMTAQDKILHISNVFTQKLTHQRVHGTFIVVQMQTKPPDTTGWQWIKRDVLSALAFPKMLRSFLENQLSR